jgi:DNA polymerase
VPAGQLLPLLQKKTSAPTNGTPPLQPVFIDLETQSECNLQDEGGRRYAAHPTTRIFMAVAIFGGRAIVWLPIWNESPPVEIIWPEGYGLPRPIEIHVGRALPSSLADAIQAGRPFAAHNASGFDALVWSAQGLPEPKAWVDTLPWARAAGCPGGLDAASCWLLDLSKDNAGAKLLAKYTRLVGKTKKFREIPPEDLAVLVCYNMIDTLLLAKLHPLLARHDSEPNLIQLDRTINARGVCVDRDLAQAALALEAEDSARLAREAEQTTDGTIKATDLNRTAFLGEWLESKGYSLPPTEKDRPSLRKEIADGLLRRKNLPDDVRAVLVARRATGRVTTKKLEKALALGDADGRLRNQFVYYGAHTGRWTGHNAQPQNLPKPHQDLKDLTPLIEAVHDGATFRTALPEGVSFSDGLSALVRPCFVAGPNRTLAIADFASIEARGVAWLAGEETLLDAFRLGRDSYCELASKIFGRTITKKDKQEREIGKIAVLGCGYNMGAKRFAVTCKNKGVDLAAANTTPEQVVTAFRDAFPRIAGVARASGYGRANGIWKLVEFAAFTAVRDGQACRTGRCTFAKEGDALVITLPSGRRSHYRNARIEKRVPGYGGGAKPTLVYDAPDDEGRRRKKGAKRGKGGHGWEEATYGGKLVENITSAVCRDLLAEAMLQCEKAGLPVVLHAQDEIVIEVPITGAEDALRQLLAIMSKPPAWAEGFPIEVEGYTSFRYVKSPLPGALIVKARNGVVIEEIRLPGTPPPPPSFQPPSPPAPIEDNGKNTTLPLPPARTNDQAHNGTAPVPPLPSPPVPPPALPPAIIASPSVAPDWFHVGIGQSLDMANVYVGDCRKALAQIPPASVDSAATDPPYCIGQHYGSHYDDSQSETAFLGMLEEVAWQILRVLKANGSLWMVMGSNLQAEVLVMLKRVGFHCRRTIPWHETFGEAQQSNFTPSWRAIHYMVKDPENFIFNADAVRVPSQRQLKYNDKRARAGGKLPDDVWLLLHTWALIPGEQMPELKSGELDLWLASRECGTFKSKVAHVNQMPLAIMDRIIKVATHPGQIVLDPFFGTGTTGVAAAALGRRHLGIELSEKTANLAKEEFAQRLAAWRKRCGYSAAREGGEP